jgi:hypothetical protein
MIYNFRSRDEYYAQYSVSRILLYPTIIVCCGSGTDNDWHCFWVDPLGLCDIAMLLMSIPESTLSLGHIYISLYKFLDIIILRVRVS